MPHKTKHKKQSIFFHSIDKKILISIGLIFFSLIFILYPGTNIYINYFAFDYKKLSTVQKHKVAVLKEIRDTPILRTNNKPLVLAEGAYVIELESATPLFERNIHKKFLPASTTKVMTALTAYDMFGLDSVLEVKRLMEIGQVVGLIKGEKLTFENLLYAILIHSGNDAAYVVADNTKGGYKVFIEKMNQKAKELKMNDSLFINPAGLDSLDQYTTAYDLALAGRALLKNRELARIVSIKNITISDVDYKYFHPLFNVNRLLGEIPGVGGLKTGKTELAGENLVTFYKKNGKKYLIVLLKSQDRFEDTKNIVKWIDENVEYRRVGS